MKSFIKQRIREEMIDGQEMDKGLQTLCNTLTVNSYDEVLNYVKAALKQYNDIEQYQLMQKLHVPLVNLKHAEINLNSEKETLNMTGDSLPDIANGYWKEIQTILCEQGSPFQ
jgi:hypothetical protein